MSATLMASTVAASASVAEESSDNDTAVVVSAPVLDDSARAAHALRSSRTIGTTEHRADARASRKKVRQERRRKALVRERKQQLRERRALAPDARPARAGSTRALGKRLARQHGFESWWQWNCLDALWTAESGWRSSAANGSTGAYGIPQAYPGSKMSSHGSDWRSSPRTQIRWGLSYIDDRWGTPCGAYGHFKRARWY